MTPAGYQEVGRRADGSIMWRVRLLALIANAVGVQFKVGGWPYGASYERAINHEPRRRGRIDMCAGLRPYAQSGPFRLGDGGSSG